MSADQGFSQPPNDRNLQGTWRQALTSFSISIVILLAIRWALFEPYVIPSGSMLPTLKILDYIYVNKFEYGIRLPFSNFWIWERNLPSRCDVVVFRSQTHAGQFVIKRVIGIPGDRVELLESGRVRVNDTIWPTRIISENDGYRLLEERCSGDKVHAIQVSKVFEDLSSDSIVYSVQVPEGELALFGDNRHESADSREWGTLTRNDLLGKAQGIWLSCESSLPGLPRVCDPTTLRSSRMFVDFDKNALSVEARIGN